MQFDSATNRSKVVKADTHVSEGRNSFEYMQVLQNCLQAQKAYLSTLDSLRELRDRCRQSLARGKNLALAFSDNPQTSREYTFSWHISESLGSTGPRPIEPDGHEDDAPTWIEVIKAKKRGEDVDRGDGHYHWRVQGRTFEWNEKEDEFLRLLTPIQFPYEADIPEMQKSISNAVAFARMISKYFAEGSSISAEGKSSYCWILDNR